jgi:hypothetical protein
MRNFTSISMVLFGIWTALSGIIELTPIATGDSDHHVIAAILFGAACCVHAWLNRKAIFGYFRKLRWQWGLVGLVLLLTVVTTVGHP